LTHTVVYMLKSIFIKIPCQQAICCVILAILQFYSIKANPSETDKNWCSRPGKCGTSSEIMWKMVRKRDVKLSGTWSLQIDEHWRARRRIAIQRLWMVRHTLTWKVPARSAKEFSKGVRWVSVRLIGKSAMIGLSMRARKRWHRMWMCRVVNQWNALPEWVRGATSVNDFKNKYDYFIYVMEDNSDWAQLRDKTVLIVVPCF